MAKQAPNPIDIQDFQFKAHCRLKVFGNEDSAVFNKPCNLVATASRFGLIFVGTSSSTFQVIQINSIEKYTLKDGEITNYYHRVITLPSPPKHLAISCDSTKLAVVVERNNCSIALIYDVTSFMKQNATVLTEIRLSPTPGVNVVETSWNPGIPNIFTACKEDGTLGLYEFKETGIDINELPAESQACCMCWSPKGKQIAVGSRDGKITQYKPDLKAAKVVNAPNLEEPHSIVALQWISNYQFIAVYKPVNSGGGASVLVVDSPKTGDTVYTNYEDICYSFGNTRPAQFYMIHQSIWNVLMVASSNSMEVGVLGSENEQWTQWILADAARAELPLSASKQETMPVGLGFDTSAIEPVLWGESSLPPAPFLLLLSHHGLLCCFRVINIKSGVATICQAPEALADMSGLSQFTNASSVVITKPPTSEPQQQITAAILPPKPAVVTTQASLPLLTQFSAPQAQLPQVALFTSPPTSLFEMQQPLQAAKPEPASIFKSDVSQPSFFAAKSIPQNLFTSSTPQQVTPTPAVTMIVPTVKTSTVSPAVTAPPAYINEPNIVQEEADLLISKLVREECETLEAEFKVLLHKARSIKIDLGTDTEAVDLVHGTNVLDDFLKEITENNAAQGAEVHSLKQGLICTWTWYEDAVSRYAQAQDAALEALIRTQRLDPVSQRYLADIEHMTYYMESQLMQASRVLDEQWENFQDSCKKIMRLKIPTMEAIYQTMVRQSATYQKQKYVLKDLSSRIRAHRSKINGPSLLVSLNNADQLERELQRLQLEPQHLLQAQYERVLQNEGRLSGSKVQKLRKLLSEREVTHVVVSKPQLSNTSLQSLIQSNTSLREQTKLASASQALQGATLSPIFASKPIAPRTVDFTQSTPKITSPAIPTEQKQGTVPLTSEVNNMLKGLPPGLSIKFTTGSSMSTATSAATTTSITKTEAPLQFKFSTIPTSSVQPNTQTTTTASTTDQLNFNFAQFNTAPKTSINVTPVSQGTSQANQFSFSTTLNTSKPSVSFGSLFSTTKPTSTFNFSFSSAGTTGGTTSQPSNIKPLASTSSSAFVPTTQHGFNFNAKSSAAISVSTSVVTSNTTSKPSTFVFGPSTPIFTPPSVPTAKPIMATSDASKTIASTASTNTTVTTAPVLSIFKTPAPTSAALPTLTAFKTSESEAISKPILTVPSIQQAVPTVTTISLSSEAPLSLVVSKVSTDNKTVPLTQPSVSSSQGSFFGIASSVPSQTTFSFGTALAKTSQTLTPQSTTTPSVFSDTTVTITSSGKANESTTQPSIFAKPAATSVPSSVTPGSIFGAPATITGSLFGNTAATAPASIFATTTTASDSIFGAVATQQSTTPVSSVAPTFTAATTTPTTMAAPTSSTSFAPPVTTATSGFGLPTPTSTLASPVFAATPPAATTTTSIFGSPGFVTTTSTTPSVFGQPVSSTPSAFAAATSPAFGAPQKTTNGPFGSPSFSSSTTSAFGNSNSATSGSLFGQPAVFGTSSVFGAPVSSTTNTFGSGGSVFGASNTAASDFGQSQSSSFSFAAAAASVPSANSAFGFSSKPAFGFGTTAATTDSSSFSFGNLNMGAAATTNTNNAFGSGFGQTAGSPNPNPFAKPAGQEQKPAFGGGSLFGTPSPATTTTSIFGGGQSTGFGNTSTFGGSPTFGQQQQPTFGQQQSSFGGSFGSPTQPGPFSGGNQSVAQTGFGAFGQAQKPSGFGAAPVFGGSPTGGFAPAPAFGAASPTFGAASPAFGAAPSFGSPSKVFGNTPSPTGTFGTAPQQQNPTFANLATQNTLGFGALAQQTQPAQASSPFSGGSSFSTWR